MTLIDRFWRRLRGDDADLQNRGRSARSRVVGLSMVKNEQDIIEPFIRHNAQFLDAMVVIDNASVDATRRIAIDCARELGNVIVADSAQFAYTQGAQMTRLLHQCQSAFFADFIFFLDADEFISATDREELLGYLRTIPPGGVGLMPWQTFVLHPDDNLTAAGVQDPPRTLRYRRNAETPVHSKAVLRLDGAVRPELVVWQGLHNVVTATGDFLPLRDLDDLPLLHFPVRGRNQLVAKTVIGWMAYLARNPGARDIDEGTHWRDIFDRIVSPDAAPSDRELCDISMRYAQERAEIDWPRDAVAAEPPSDYIRRFSTGTFCDPISLIARSWERSLAGSPEPLHLHRPDPARSDASALTGATSFDADWHWDHLFVDVAPFRFIAEKYAPASVLDIGCGIGAYLKLFEQYGAATIRGVDGIPAGATALTNETYQALDLAQPLYFHAVFDLVVCVEVAEHLEPQYGENLLDSITRHAGKTIIFSAAEPDQPGHGHINCMPIAYWLERLAARGWYPDLIDSLGMRSLATFSWFRRNLVVLRYGDPAPAAIAALAEIGERPFSWYSQAPGVRALPFSEEPLGYAAG